MKKFIIAFLMLFAVSVSAQWVQDLELTATVTIGQEADDYIRVAGTDLDTILLGAYLQDDFIYVSDEGTEIFSMDSTGIINLYNSAIINNNHADSLVITEAITKFVGSIVAYNYIPRTDATYDVGAYGVSMDSIYVDDLVVDHDAVVTGTLSSGDVGTSLTSDTDATDDLGAYGTSWDSLYVDDAVVDADLTVGDDLTVTATISVGDVGTSLTSDTDATDDLGAYGTSWDSLYVDDAVIDHDATIGNDLTITATLSVGDVGSSLTSDTDATDKLGTYGTAWDSLYVDDAVVDVDLSVGTDLTVGNDLTVTATLSVGDVGSSLTSDTDATDNLGTYGTSWDSLYVDDAVIDVDLSVGTDLTVTGTLFTGDVGSSLTSDTDATDNLGTYGTSWDSLYVDDAVVDVDLSVGGTLSTGDVGTDLTSDTDATDDLGAYGTSWDSLYVDDAVVDADLTVGDDLTVNGGNIEVATGVTTIGTAATDTISITGLLGVGTVTPDKKFDLTFPDNTANAGAIFQNSDGSIILVNGTGSSNAFYPLISGTAGGANTRFTEMRGQILTAYDSGTYPALILDGRRTDGVLQTRHVLGIANYGTRLITVNKDGYTGFLTEDPDAVIHIVSADGPQLIITDTAGADSTTFEVDGNGDLTVVPSGGDVVITGTLSTTDVGSSLISDTDATDNLGTYGTGWDSLYVDDAVIDNDLTVSGLGSFATEGILLPNTSTAPGPAEGQMYYQGLNNGDADTLFVYNGTSWKMFISE